MLNPSEVEASVARGLLVRCPTCHEWFEAADLVRPGGATETSTADRCPRDGTALEPPLPRVPPPPQTTPREDRVNTVIVILLLGYSIFMAIWVWVALPFLAVAGFLLASSGNAALLIAWAVVSALWLVLLKFIGPINS